jgi:hypothetical protein
LVFIVSGMVVSSLVVLIDSREPPCSQDRQY